MCKKCDCEGIIITGGLKSITILTAETLEEVLSIDADALKDINSNRFSYPLPNDSDNGIWYEQTIQVKFGK